MKRRVGLCLSLIVTAWLVVALGQGVSGVETEIVVRPASEPIPALKYRLVPEKSALVQGNAAIFYHRAMHFWIQSRRPVTLGEKTRVPVAVQPITPDVQVSQWIELPLDQIPMDAARSLLGSVTNVLREIELGTQRSTCDWEFDSRQEGFSLLIPEIQEIRTLARLVALKCRVAIHDGKTDEAFRWIHAGLVMGRHVGNGPIGIQALVGIAIDNVMIRCLDELIQTPGMPSLFWTLADRPRPFIDMRGVFDGEKNSIAKALPPLRELDGAPWSLERAREFTNEFEKKLYSLFGSRLSEDKMSALSRQLGVAAMAAKIYPTARRSLVAQGYTSERVDAMPVVQVSVLYTLREYMKDLDDVYKWLNVPYWKSYAQIDKGMPRRRADEKLVNPLLTMFNDVTPALNSLRLAALRLERQLDAIQCVEAIRQYASAHSGQLPPSLDVLVDTPVPLDVLTGKPFGYTVDGDRAVLSAPLPPGCPNHPSYRVHFVLKLAK